jgi:guanylate kinase
MDQKFLEKLNSYQVPDRAIDLIRNSRVVFLVGVSAAGKDSVLSGLLKSDDYHLIISHTTRKPRENNGIAEQDGVEYHFIDLQTAEKMLDNHEYIEAKQYSGNVYGTSIAELQKAQDDQKIAITDIEVQGVVEYRSVADNVIPIFILPPDFDTWMQRLTGRYQGNINQQDLNKRLHTAKHELEESLKKPYFQYVVNQDLDQAIQIADAIAHGNFSEKKNELAKNVAKQLLKDLDGHIGTLDS